MRSISYLSFFSKNSVAKTTVYFVYVLKYQVVVISYRRHSIRVGRAVIDVDMEITLSIYHSIR